jgi:hypothetical protein
VGGVWFHRYYWRLDGGNGDESPGLLLLVDPEHAVTDGAREAGRERGGDGERRGERGEGVERGEGGRASVPLLSTVLESPLRGGEAPAGERVTRKLEDLLTMTFHDD